tara:strand:- start:5057 stop:5536 length:480 start_codon:yes stop_codon:yes gene_type:complete
MSAASNDLEDKLLDHVLRNTSYSQPSTLRIALFAGTASDVLAALEAGTGSRSGTGNWGHYEITGGAYERKAITFASASGGSAASNANCTFDTATANYNNEATSGSTITCMAVMDGAFTPDGSTTHTGNVLFYGQLDNAKEVLSGDTFQITSGNLTISLA